jgi:hypothetical protein
MADGFKRGDRVVVNRPGRPAEHGKVATVECSGPGNMLWVRVDDADPIKAQLLYLNPSSVGAVAVTS